jgi:hypothetical protein
MPRVPFIADNVPAPSVPDPGEPRPALHEPECETCRQRHDDNLHKVRAEIDLRHGKDADKMMTIVSEPSTDEIVAETTRRRTQLAAEEQLARIEAEEVGQVVLAAVPAYPAGQVAGPLGDLVGSSTLPAALIGGAGLGVLAALAARADIVLPGSRQRPSLWIPLIAPTSGGKSPALDRALELLLDLDAVAHDDYRRAMTAWKMLSDTEKTVSPRPADGALLISDATLEAVARKLNRSGGVALDAEDELSRWLSAFGQYKQQRGNGDQPKWLSLWSGAPWAYQRVGGAKDDDFAIDLLIRRPVVPVMGGIQPHLLHLLGDADSGFRARWLPHCSEQQDIPWDGWSPAGREAWETVIRRMHAARAEPREWSLSGNAADLWRAAEQRWRAEARAEASKAVRAALAKAPLQCARVALVLAESEDPHPGSGGIIPSPPMCSAVAITDYCMNVWRALPGHEVFALSIRDEKLARGVDELRDWLAARPERKATKREILRGHAAGVRTVKDMKVLLDAYAQTYGPGLVAADERAGSRGPRGVTVHAPARGGSAFPESSSSPASKLSPGDNFGAQGRSEPGDETAGQEIAQDHGGTVASGDSLAGDSCLATVSAADGDLCRLCGMREPVPGSDLCGPCAAPPAASLPTIEDLLGMGSATL